LEKIERGQPLQSKSPKQAEMNTFTEKLTGVQGWTEEQHKQKQDEAIQSNLLEREFIRGQIRRCNVVIAQKVPGTIRKAQKERKELRERLRTLIHLSGALYNGGIW